MRSEKERDEEGRKESPPARPAPPCLLGRIIIAGFKSLTSTPSQPDIQRRQGRAAPLQEPRRPHPQLPLLLQLQLRQTPRADGGVLAAAVERRERRDTLQRVRNSAPALDAQLVSPGEAEQFNLTIAAHRNSPGFPREP